ncbi:hypothetical protein HDR63_04130 [bacterium]|nr:hypothetical protein [bacterium]
MKQNKNIFAGKVWALMLGAVLMAAPAMAAVDNGCSDPNSNPYIAPGLALCSTHVYNIGATQNVSTAEDKQYMREVIALKTTLMTQQMYKQYEFLDATMQRLKTQLEKSVLTSAMQAAGAATDSGTSSAANSKNRNIILNGADDCIAKASKATVLDCLQSNLMLVRTAATSGNYGNAKRQLDRDIEAYKSWMLTDVSPCGTLSATRESVTTCINKFNVAIASVKEDLNRSNNNQMGGIRFMNLGQGD